MGGILTGEPYINLEIIFEMVFMYPFRKTIIKTRETFLRSQNSAIYNKNSVIFDVKMTKSWFVVPNPSVFIFYDILFNR